MKINYSKSIVVWVWLMVWLGIGYVAYRAQQSRIVADSITVFARSIEIEKTMFLPQPIQSFYDPKLSPTPDIQREEKEVWIDQHILYKENPNRSRLDSIFNAELQKSGIADKDISLKLMKGIPYMEHRNNLKWKRRYHYLPWSIG